MKKEYRIKTAKDFNAIFATKQSKANKQFVVYFLKKDNQKHFRLGLSVSKKLGNAVVRNHIKRKIRQAFFELQDLFYNEYDIIVIARVPAVNLSVVDTKKSLYHVCQLAQLIRK